jgi:hypothetical protein
MDRKITVQGINSKKTLLIDLDVLGVLMKAYLQDTPRELRDPSKVIPLIVFCQEVTELYNNEVIAAEEIAIKEISVAIAESVDNNHTSENQIDEFEARMLNQYKKE